MKHWQSLALVPLAFATALVVAPLRPAAQAQSPQAAPPYIPQARFCANGSNGLCAIVPAYIGPDPGLAETQGYNGLYGQPPQSEKADVQSPFDNMAWQMFVALNWAASGVKEPPAQGLTQPGRRVWQTYPTVSSLFGNAPVIVGCPQALALPIFHIGSNGKGQPMPNNEEYLQAATNKPLIDVNGNWTLFERRVNEIEAQYLRAPGGQKSQTLTTRAGQQEFINKNPGGADFTSSATVPDGTNGSIEIKASWRILDPSKDDPSKFFTQNILLAVSGDSATAQPQAVRCWRIYPTTSTLNEQWRMALGSLKSVFGNYMLVGTQWGGNVEPPTPPNPIPSNAVPGMLSNMTLETYIQNYLSNGPAGPGSCVSCHNFATLVDGKTSANFSFLPGIVEPASLRAKIKTAP
ncbi:hypothetical protein [Bradyrhizobium liaoningense]|uniref:hypothetical protein n=1 Tax=Bradyrhizobium liaoningense TaxID=43992 RepID=UPI001BAD6641|nr:hypothetical protein [Bradyrhizobium liaoningense]MBR0705853.1 hypothetical protein [Bradyrhizobium liaoningense]